jgi:DNA-binding Lrp family transcriptional regulator
MGAAEFELLNRFQRDFPLTSQPFQVIAERLGWSEGEVLSALHQLQQAGKVSRVGTVFAARPLGVSTLAALAVPQARLEAVARRVNDYSEVNHNYQREHDFNLWFVLTAATATRLHAVLAELGDETGLPVLDLPLLEEFHIDLGFDLRHGRRETPAATSRMAADDSALVELSELDHRILAALQPGLPLVSRPYHILAGRVGLSEQTVLERLRYWLERRVIKRFGVIVRHRELGYRANAMVVWDIPDAEASAVGRALAAESGVNLCYRRPRRLPHWPYNLFCMMHGRQREQVLERIERLRIEQGLLTYPYAVLFSTRCFRQRGAYYLPMAMAPTPLPEREENWRVTDFGAAA